MTLQTQKKTVSPRWIAILFFSYEVLFTGLAGILLALVLYFIFAIAQLTAFRILMVWVYDNTKSLLVAILMHASYIFSTLFVFAPPTTGIPFLVYSGTFTTILWLIVAAVTLINRRQLV